MKRSSQDGDAVVKALVQLAELDLQGEEREVAEGLIRDLTQDPKETGPVVNDAAGSTEGLEVQPPPAEPLRRPKPRTTPEETAAEKPLFHEICAESEIKTRNKNHLGFDSSHKIPPLLRKGKISSKSQ